MLRLSLCLLAAACLAGPGSALAGTPAPLQSAASQQADAWSSASKPKRKRAVVVQQPYYSYQSYGWRPADPSFDRDGRPYRNPFPGQCMVDLGYGRFESCDQVGGR
jgi:hypothetical protein